MAENYKKRYEEVKHMLEMYQDEIVPNLRKELDKRVKLVHCRDCKHWHEETSWCTVHSHFVDSIGFPCHPSESPDWKMFDEDYF